MFQRRVALGILAITGSFCASAVEVEQISVTKDGRLFKTSAEFVVHLPKEEVFRAFTAFDDLATLNPTVVESQAETLSDGLVRVTTRLRDCIVFFCKTLRLVEDVSLLDEGVVRSAIVPDHSDFASGKTVWRFESVESGTQVSYRSEVQPDFWLPPIIGSRALSKGLKRQILTAAARLEATQIEAGPMEN